eukprot:scaffold42803_cov206-Amphora_coffeaeformis.AAC.1
MAPDMATATMGMGSIVSSSLCLPVAFCVSRCRSLSSSMRAPRRLVKPSMAVLIIVLVVYGDCCCRKMVLLSRKVPYYLARRPRECREYGRGNNNDDGSFLTHSTIEDRGSQKTEVVTLVKQKLDHEEPTRSMKTTGGTRARDEQTGGEFTEIGRKAGYGTILLMK